MNFKNLKTDINNLSIGEYDRICKTGNLNLLITDKDKFDREFVLSLMDKIREIINSDRSILSKILAFFRLMIGLYHHNTNTVAQAKKRHLEKAFDYIDTQIFELRGASSDMLKKKRIKEQIINLANEVYNKNNKFASNRMRQLKAELEKLENEGVAMDIAKTFAYFSKEQGYHLKPFDVSIVEFFGYADRIAEINK